MRLGREFFERDALVVAPELLGKALVTVTPEMPLSAEFALATHSSWVALGGFALLSVSAPDVATMNRPDAVVPKIEEKPPSVT